MTRHRINIICLIAITFFLFGPALCRAEYEYIDISNPFLRKIPIAVPFFKTIYGSDAETEMSKKASNLLSEALKFTGYFKILDREAFLSNPGKSNIKASNINFRNWTGIGAELLITGGLLIKDDIVEMELRLFDTFKERLLIGKKYKGWKSDQRKMIHRFCAEVVYLLTGSQGIFGSKIAFVSSGSGNKEIYMCEFDGYKVEQVTHVNNITLSPAWSSDAKWIAYTSYARGKPELYIKHLKEKRGTIVGKKGVNITPAWVPGEFSLAATLSFSGDQEIYLLTGTGKIIKRLTRKRGIDVSPALSPDGKKMAFVSQRSGKPQIHIKHLDSGQVERLTFEGRYNTQPNWSPKGDRIAYSAMENGWINICVIGLDGKDSVQLTHNAGNNESPSWSPDGSLIAFSSTREGPSRIYVMNANGTDQRRLLTLPGEQTNPKWSPRVIDN